MPKRGQTPCGGQHSPDPESGIRDLESRILPFPALSRWSLGLAFGLALAAIEIVPLACYLSRSPVWYDRKAERTPILAISRPRVLDSATTALPYLYGSQRRGHPHIARALGVHNLNEAAGGFAGLATLVLLAPASWGARKNRPVVRFLAGLAAVGAMGAFGVFPVANLLRALPVLDVADNRRLTLWVAFALCLLGGIGIDALSTSIRGRAWVFWSRGLVVVVVLLGVSAGLVVAAGPRLKEKSNAHYAAAARETPGADASEYRGRAERQAQAAMRFLPRYYLLSAAHLALIGALAMALRRISKAHLRNSEPDGLAQRTVADRRSTAIRGALSGLVLVDLVAFGYGLNPAIPRWEDRPESALIAYLRRECPPPARIIGLGAELPPNVLMRYGLADARNYDSVELTRSLDWFEPMYEADPGRPSRSSRRTILWAGAVRSLDRLRLAGVRAIVGASPPPAGVFDRVDRVGGVWIARMGSRAPEESWRIPAEIRIDLRHERGQVRWVPETFDPGWKAEIDGHPAEMFPHLGSFLGTLAPSGARTLVFRYDPPEVRIALAVSLAALAMILVVAIVGQMAGNTASEAWMASAHRVKIGPQISARPPLPGSPLDRGCDADGPLHV